MKRLTLILVVAIFALTLSSCTGFNQRMYDYLSNAENYCDYQVTVQELIQRDDGGMIITVIFDNYKDVSAFLGGTPNHEIALSEYVFSLEITAENVEILTRNDFFDEIKSGNVIMVKVSDFIYSDSGFFYVAELSSNGKVYLDFEEGLRNIVDMMDRDRSIF